MRRFLGAVAASLLASTAVLGQTIGTPIQQGANNNDLNTSTITLSPVTCAQGNVLLVFAASNSQTLSSTLPVSDGYNTYTLGAAAAGSSAMVGTAWAVMNTALSSATLTVTYAGNSTAKTVTAYCMTNTWPVDINGVGTGGAGMTGTGASTSLSGSASAASEIVWGFLATSSSTSDMCGAGSCGLTPTGTPGTSVTSGNPYLYTYYTILSGGTPPTTETYTPNWTTSRAYGANMVSFEAGTPPLANPAHGLLLLGAGE